jgi:pyrophosphatase PpaX
MFGPILTYIFDFDGTLVNSMASVVKGLQNAIEVGSGRVVSERDLIATFGVAPLAILQKWVADPDRVEMAWQAWLEFERTSGAAAFEPFEGVTDLLAEIHSRGLKMGVFTGRDRASTLRILRHHGWLNRYFTETSIICGDDGFPTKPKPEALQELMRRLGANPTTTLMTGDHEYDMQAGRAAGTKVAAALWDLPQGRASRRASYKEAWSKWDAVSLDLRLESPRSLVEWLRLAQ